MKSYDQNSNFHIVFTADFHNLFWEGPFDKSFCYRLKSNFVTVSIIKWKIQIKRREMTNFCQENKKIDLHLTCDFPAVCEKWLKGEQIKTSQKFYFVNFSATYESRLQKLH